MLLSVDKEVRPGDLEAGDVIAVPHAAGRLLVTAVHLGQGGFILTVEPADGSAPGAGRQVTLAAGDRVSKLGRAPVL